MTRKRRIGILITFALLCFIAASCFSFCDQFRHRDHSVTDLECRSAGYFGSSYPSEPPPWPKSTAPYPVGSVDPAYVFTIVSSEKQPRFYRQTWCQPFEERTDGGVSFGFRGGGMMYFHRPTGERMDNGGYPIDANTPGYWLEERP